jgi:cell division transport system permease protein
VKPLRRRRDKDDLAARWRPAPLLPRERVQDLLLVFVAAVLCFFACLSVIAALGANRAAEGWTAQLKSSATVIVRPGADEGVDAAAERAAETLAGVKGVREASALERSKAEALVKPWLGDGAELADLPLPRLVAVEFDPARPPPPGALQKALKAAGVDATVDDHSRWIRDIVRGGELARAAAAALAGLVVLSAFAVIAFATRAGLDARREIIEVLHLSGAEDRFIVALFQNRLAEIAALAGALGAAGAALAAALLRLLGGGEGIFPVLPIAWSDLLAVLPCPLIAALVAAAAARITAFRLIGRLP